MEEKSIQSSADSNHVDHGWQKVTYVKKQRKAAPAAGKTSGSGVSVNGVDKDNVFKSLEKSAEERRKKLAEAKIASAAAAMAEEDGDGGRRRRRWGDEDDEDDSSDVERGNVAAKVDDKKEKKAKKKEKKPKVTVAEAAAAIDAADLSAFLTDVSGTYDGQQDIQLMRFADYFGRAFSGVTASQFPWLKLFRESPVAKIADVPVSHVSEAVYKTSVDWINKCSYEALGSFVLWSLDSILADLAIQQAASKGSKKGVKQTSSKSKVAIFVVLSMVLRRKPDVLINLFPTLRENAKYQGQDRLPVIVWMIVQACQGDLAVGLYLWAHHILPLLGGKSGSNPQSRDLVLQLVERILSAPKARTILVNGAVRKGERLVPPAALDLLLRVTFPVASARVKATERFEAIYPTLKEVALAGSPGSKAMKQVSQQILAFVFKAAGEGTPALSQEAISVSIWCLMQNPDCFKQWDKLYSDNIEVSLSMLRKLTEEWKEFSAKQLSLEATGETLKNFRRKNEEALNGGVDADHRAHYKDADKYCKVLLGRLSRGHGCMKTMAFTIIVLAAGAAVMSPNFKDWDWNKLSIMINPHHSF